MQAARLIRRAVPLILMGAAGVAVARRRMERRGLRALPESPLGGPAGEARADVPAGGPSKLPVSAPVEAEEPAVGKAASPAPATPEAQPPGAVEGGMEVPTVVDADPAGPTVVDVEVLPDAPEPEAEALPEPEQDPVPEADVGDESIAEQEPTIDAEAPTTEVPAIEEPPTSVSDIVDDLIAPRPPGGERIEDATVVEGDEPGDPAEGARERR